MPWFRRTRFVSGAGIHRMQRMAFMRSSSFGRQVPVLVMGIVGAGLAFAAPAAAQGFLLDNAPMKGALTTLGIIAPDREPIEYHERAPLVVPKTMSLPQPAAAQASSRNPAWPTDPDVALKLKEKAEGAQPVVRSQSAYGDKAALSIWSMLGGKSAEAPVEPAGPSDNGGYVHPESGFIRNPVLRAQGAQFAAQNFGDQPDQIRPGYEPKRKFLTDPPSGYRRPSDKATFKKQYGAPDTKNAKGDSEGDSARAFIKEQKTRQQGAYDRDQDQ
jgi:hypothetical protein